MFIQDISKYRIVKVTDHPEHVETLTRTGWRLLGVLAGSIPVALSSHNAQISLYDQRSGCNSVNGSITLPNERALLVPVFLLGFDETESMAITAKERDAAKEELLKLRQVTMPVLEAELYKSQRGAESLKARTESLEGSLNKAHADAEQWRQKNLKFEADHAKLEKEIGGARMREILGCVPTPDAQKPKL